METYQCYHGTSADAARAIVAEQRFIASMEDTEWAGHGVYFFIDSIPPPIHPTAYLNAYNWAKYIKRVKTPTVLKSTVTIDPKDILDLRDEEYLADFHQVRLEIYQSARRRAKDEGIEIDSSYLDNRWLDCLAINQMCQLYDPPMAAVITKLCINFHKKISYPVSQYPNCTILCVRNGTLISDTIIA